MNRAGKVIKSFFYDLPIRYKLLAVYTTIFTVAIILGSMTIYAFVKQTIETGIESELRNSTATLVNMVRTTATVSIKNHLRAVAEKNREIVVRFHQQYAKGELSEEDAKRMATDVLLSQTIGQTGYIYCINSPGVLQVHPKEPLRGVDLSHYDFIREQMKRKNGYLEYEWKNPGEIRERPKALYMVYFAPWDWIISVSSYREEFTSLVNVDDFRENIVSIRLGKTGYCYVIDSSGNFVIHPQLTGNAYDSKDAVGRAFIKEICERKTGRIIYPWQNPGEKAPREKLVFFDYLPEFDWIVASSSYLDEFNAPLHAIKKITIITVLTTLVVVLLLTLWMSRSITNPLRTLMNHFTDGAGRSLAARMEVRSSDEIGQLAHYFNDFMTRLEASHNALQAEISVRKLAEQELEGYRQHLEELVEQRTAELKESYARLEEANTRIMDSIEYARTIQRAILPKRDEVSRYADDSFVIWRPKDVIGGDLFWFGAGKDEFLLAVIDCTGHGVPGAVMTMIAAATLDRVVHEVGYGDPALILQNLNAHVQRSLHQQTSEALSNDGMDVGLCYVNREEGFLTYAGARTSLFYSAEGRIIEIKGDRQSIGYKSSDLSYAYSTHHIPVDSSKAFYMSTDGLPDQVGGIRNLPFGKKRFIEFLLEHHQEPLHRQEALLLETFEGYRGNEVQRDDIMVVGFRI